MAYDGGGNYTISGDSLTSHVGTDWYPYTGHGTCASCPYCAPPPCPHCGHYHRRTNYWFYNQTNETVQCQTSDSASAKS